MNASLAKTPKIVRWIFLKICFIPATGYLTNIHVRNCKLCKIAKLKHLIKTSFKFLLFKFRIYSKRNLLCFLAKHGGFLAIELHLPNRRSIILLFKKLISFQVRDLLFPFHSSGSQEGRRTRNWFLQSSLPVHEVIFYVQGQQN